MATQKMQVHSSEDLSNGELTNEHLSVNFYIIPNTIIRVLWKNFWKENSSYTLSINHPGYS